MDWHATILFIHILALVFWLGTDVGVFVLGKFAQNEGYSVDQRLLLMKVAMILDMFPRVFMVLTLPTGFALAVSMGGIFANSIVSAGVYLFSALWLAVVIVGLLRPDAPVGETAKSLEKVIHYILILSLTWAGMSSLLTGGPILLPWLAVKLLGYAAIVVVMRLLEKAFMPAVLGFMDLEISGSSPALERQIRSGMDLTYMWVSAIYLLVLLVAYLGVAQPW